MIKVVQRCLLFAICASLGAAVSAEVQFDGTTTADVGVLSGAIEITEQQGLLTGSQDALLHSFLTFGIRPDESVSFTHLTPSVQNILVRVTGGGASNIDGQLSSDTNLWLLNPNGVMFGAGAQLDIQGVMRVNENLGAVLVLEDGSAFGVDTNLNTLSVAKPADFGFATDVATTNVVADPSLGTQVTSVANASGADHLITGGTSAGANLFHSFERFSVFSADSALFSDNSATPFTNVISRVTGGSRSYFLSSVTTTGTGLDGTRFWFLNPAGLFVGSGGSFNVGNALFLGAAESVQSDAGDTFGLATPNTQLFVANASEFGFTPGVATGNLIVDGLAFTQSLFTPGHPDSGFGLAGSNVALLNTNVSLFSVAGQSNELFVNANNGQLQLVNSNLFASSFGLANAARIDLRGGDLSAVLSNVGVSTDFGDLTQPLARIGADFERSIFLDRSSMQAVTFGLVESGSLVLQTEVFAGLNSTLATASAGVGGSGGIIVDAMGGKWVHFFCRSIQPDL